ncbi:MauE/DoxX family redox-associated membrane protein [Erythrobacter sp. THAF29]|uniref:MauE/DoxX family redox-associated membrane protein n=1 Tax=Erythrobacter sp. THAF29 TaxID=2587851 RepID=UPI0012680002|nr:glutaredoxin [Erythrobacter sp. THAF29]QFT77831.1 Glutaredoxin-3 [Erythrobacter sp. THAF29]
MDKAAQLYRMVTDDQVCPYGIKAKHLLESRGYKVEDHPLASRDETDAFKAQHGVDTTPQVFIDGKRVGGYDSLRELFGIAREKGGKSYRPVLAVFAVALALSVSVSLGMLGSLGVRTIEWFVAFSMAMLAMLKLQDVEQFSSMFIGYDLLGRRYVPYAYAYPYLEALAAVLMAGRVLPWISIPVALFIGTVGAVSVFYAVYIQKRELKCACVGGSGDVPLGFISLSENLAMIGMALWMVLQF